MYMKYLLQQLIALALNTPDEVLGKATRLQQLEWFISDIRSTLYGYGLPVWEQSDWKCNNKG